MLEIKILMVILIIAHNIIWFVCDYDTDHAFSLAIYLSLMTILLMILVIAV